MTLHQSKPIRDPAEVLKALFAACAQHPTQRVAQVIVNATGLADPFYVEDRQLAMLLREYAEKDPE